MAESVYLSIGTNTGDKLSNIKKLLDNLIKYKINVQDVSSIYESEPFKSQNTNNFYNLVAKVKTSEDLFNFFELTKVIESKMGRLIKNNPDIERIIDIDILVYNDIILDSKKLTIPHPRLHERRFVLLPWYEISKEYIVPKYNKSIFYLLNNVKDTSKVCKLDYKL